LLLRGAQTEGDLRARAARMDPIPDLTTLRTVVSALKARGLIVGLTPDGRGHVLTHALYQPQEMEKLRAEYRGQAQGDRPSSGAESAPSDDAPRPAPPSRPAVSAPPAPASSTVSAHVQAAANELAATVAMLRSEVDELRGELDRLRREVDDLLAQLR